MKFATKNIKEILLLLSTLILIIFVLEIFTRIYYFKPIALIPKYGNSINNRRMLRIEERVDNNEIRYQLRPNMDDYFKLTRFKTNSRGLRDKEYSLARPHNTYRVVVVGDSITMAAGVSIENAYHTILEDYYNETDRSQKYEFINFGVSGYSLAQKFATLKYKALKYNPTHILVGISPASDIIKKKGLENNNEVEGLNPYLKPWFIHFFKDKISKIFNKSKKYNFEYDTKKFKSIVGKFKDISTLNNVKMTFVVLRCCGKTYDDQSLLIRKIVLENNIDYIDTSYIFEDKNESDLIIYNYDYHPNAYSNHLFAEVIKKSFKL